MPIQNTSEPSLIWCVDPLQNPSESKNLIQELQSWGKRLGCQIRPVAVFAKNSLNFPFKTDPVWERQMEEAVKFSVDDYLKKTNVENFLEPEIIFVSAHSNRRFAVELAKYAKDTNTQAIFAQTRTQHSWNPFRLGGFAETLAATSEIPVLLMNPQARPSKDQGVILFPTDFHSSNNSTIAILSPWAALSHHQIVFFHQVSIPNSHLLGLNIPWAPEFPKLDLLMNEVERDISARAKDLSAILSKDNVSSHLILQRESKKLAFQILEQAEKNDASLMTLINRRSPMNQIFLGGTLHDLLLQAKCPVLVFFKPGDDLDKAENSQVHFYSRNRIIPERHDPATITQT